MSEFNFQEMKERAIEAQEVHGSAASDVNWEQLARTLAKDVEFLCNQSWVNDQIKEDAKA